MNETPAGSTTLEPGSMKPASLISRSTKWKRVVTYTGLTLLGTGVDLWTKQAIFRWRGLPGEQPPYWIVDDYAGFETAVNLGALFGLGQGLGWLFGVMSLVALIGILVWLFVYNACHSRWLTIAMGLITGGILGNLYDRLGMHQLPPPFTGGVRDWILFRYGQYTWPNFNIADSLLVVGACMLAIHSFWLSEPETTSTTTNS